MRSNFEACLTEIFKHEGGYVDHPRDPGGATNMGITIGTLRDWRGKPVTKADVKALTRAEAAQIYEARYWRPVRGDDLPAGVDLVAFDPAVNSGVSRGVRWLQSGLGVPQDGRTGPVTVDAARRADPVATIKRACAARMGFLRGLRTWGTFGKGWSRRVASVEAVAIRMAQAGAAQPARPALIEAKAEAQANAKRDQAGAAGAGASGGGISFADVPDWALWVGLALLAVVIVNQIGKARHQRARAEALQIEAEGVSR